MSHTGQADRQADRQTALGSTLPPPSTTSLEVQGELPPTATTTTKNTIYYFFWASFAVVTDQQRTFTGHGLWPLCLHFEIGYVN